MTTGDQRATASRQNGLGDAGRAETTESLPNLLYLGSVAVQATSAGQLQLYRLLRNYPPARLRIVEVNCEATDVSRRLSSVQYRQLSAAVTRGVYFSRTRLPALFWPMCHLNAERRAHRAAKLIAPFSPDAVLTVHEGLGWVAAAKLAYRLQIPLHIVLHDDWFRNLEMAETLRRKFERYFGSVYRAASSRFCISPAMETEYSARFGVQGIVLYPMREPGVAGDLPDRPRPRDASPGLTIAHAGNVFNPGNWEALRNVAAALEQFGGRLILYGAIKADDCRTNGLTGANVILRGFLEASALCEALEAEADVLFLPMTFEEVDKQNVRLCFPSKLADYTATTLPVLIYGPEYCSAVQWARENPGAAEVVAERGLEGINVSLRRLSDPNVRKALGCRTSQLGRKYFSFEEGSRVFSSALARAHASRVSSSQGA